MNTKYIQSAHARTRTGKTDRTRVAYLPTTAFPERVPLHCFAVGSLRSRR